MWFKLSQTQGHFCLCFPKYLTLGLAPRGIGSAFYTRFVVTECQAVPQFLTPPPHAACVYGLTSPLLFSSFRYSVTAARRLGPQQSLSCVCSHVISTPPLCYSPPSLSSQGHCGTSRGHHAISQCHIWDTLKLRGLKGPLASK